jgi:hypothetical protein
VQRLLAWRRNPVFWHTPRTNFTRKVSKRLIARAGEDRSAAAMTQRPLLPAVPAV